MPITVALFSCEQINNFPFICYAKNSLGILPVWYKSKDLEQINDVYRGTTVYGRSVGDEGQVEEILLGGQPVKNVEFKYLGCVLQSIRDIDADVTQ